MPEVFEIPVVTRLQDSGDGGYTMYVYNDEDELIKDHPSREKYDTQAGVWATRDLSEKERHDILTEDDPYKNGYIGKDTITVERAEDGSMRLAKKLSFSAGQ